MLLKGLAQAELDFSNAFGDLNNGIAFDYDFISNLVPKEIDDSLVQNSPLLKSQYASYQASLATSWLLSKQKMDLTWVLRQGSCGHLLVVGMILMKALVLLGERHFLMGAC